MRVLITGGTGFVGLALAEKLLSSGHEIVLFDLREPPAQFMQAVGNWRKNAHVETGDVGSSGDLARVFGRAGITHVFHGAAITAGPAREAAQAGRIVEVNLSATINMVQAAARAGVQRLVFPSSLTVYGEHLYRTAPLDEETTPAVPQSLYAITKYAAERAALEVGGRSGLDVVCGRIGAVFGPWEADTQARDLLSPYYQVAAAAARGVAAVLPQVYSPREMIYSRDLAQALLLLLSAERPAYPVYNLSVNANWDGLLPKWCETLTSTMPGFEWRYAAPGEASNILFPDNRPRTTMQTRRLQDDLQFSPRFLPDAALADYATWLPGNRHYFH